MAAAVGALVGAALVTIVFLMRQMRLAANAARLGAELEAAERALDDQRALVAQTQIQLRDAFASLSKDALKENRAGLPAERRRTCSAGARDAGRASRPAGASGQGARRLVPRSRARSSSLFAIAGAAAQGRRRPDAIAALAERSRQMGRNPAQAHRRTRRHDRAVRLRREGDGDDRERRPSDSRTSSSSCRATPRSSSTRRCRSTRTCGHRARTDARRATVISPRTRARCAITSARWARRNTGSSSNRRRSSS